MFFNTYMGGGYMPYNIMGISEQDLWHLVHAYHEGKKTVTIKGSVYQLDKLSPFKIFTHDLTISPADFSKKARADGMVKNSSIFEGVYYLPRNTLLLAGTDVTGDFLGNWGFGEKKKTITEELGQPLNTDRNIVFVSYSHVDAPFLKDLKRHFSAFKNQIDFWDDTRIRPGNKWKEDIKAAIKRTRVAILLVSADFLGSDFIATDELPPLLAAAENDGATVLTLILKPVLFKRFPAINQYQTINDPGEPISGMSDHKKEEYYVKLLNETLERLGV